MFEGPEIVLHVYFLILLFAPVLGTNSPRGSPLMEQWLSVFAKRQHVSLSGNPLALCWGLLWQSCTPSTALTTTAGSAVQLSCSAFEHPLRDSLPRPHGVPHRGHRVRTQQTAWRGWGGGGKMKQTIVTLYVWEMEPNWTCGLLLNKIRLDDNGHSIIMVFQTPFQTYQINTLKSFKYFLHLWYYVVLDRN